MAPEQIIKEEHEDLDFNWLQDKTKLNKISSKNKKSNNLDINKQLYFLDKDYKNETPKNGKL